MSAGAAPLRGTGSVAERLVWQAQTDPQRPFLVRVGPGGQQTVLSYRDVLLEAQAMARLLARSASGRVTASTSSCATSRSS